MVDDMVRSLIPSKSRDKDFLIGNHYKFANFPLLLMYPDMKPFLYENYGLTKGSNVTIDHVKA